MSILVKSIQIQSRQYLGCKALPEVLQAPQGLHLPSNLGYRCPSVLYQEVCLELLLPCVSFIVNILRSHLVYRHMSCRGERWTFVAITAAHQGWVHAGLH